MSSLNLYFGLFLMLVLAVNANYNVPEVLVEPLTPTRGFRVSIPDTPGIELFAFHGNLNRDIKDREAGEFSVDITEPENGRWTYTNRVKKYQPGDVLHFWVYVYYFDGDQRLGYMREGETYTFPG